VLDDRFALLFVCHANLCRSPMAERLARHRFGTVLGGAAGRVVVESAGVRAEGGAPMHPGAAQVLRERGACPDGFASRPLTPQIVAAADLVLTATRQQRAACVTLVPEAVRHTYTLRQFGRIAAGLDREHPQWTDGPPPARLRGLVRLAMHGRGRTQPVEPGDDDLADPVREPIAAFRRCADDIDAVLDTVIGS
jgi:protein-tyrosine phosphatase